MPKKKKVSYKLENKKNNEAVDIEFKWCDEERRMDKMFIGDDIEFAVGELSTVLGLVADDKVMHQLMHLSHEQMVNFKYYIERVLENDYSKGDKISFDVEFPVEVWRLEILLEELIKREGVDSSKEKFNKIISKYV